MNETPSNTGMGPDEPVGSSHSNHRNRNMIMLGGLALVLVAGVVFAGVIPTGDRAGTIKSCTDSSTCAVGDIGPGGGLVFYDAGSAQLWGQYLEMAPRTWSGGSNDPLYPWCNNDPVVNIPGTGKKLGWGARNTVAVVEACSDSAAQMAQAYDGGGKSDWFLLSENELDILSTYVRNSSLSSSYAFDSEFYWSSTQEKNTEGRSAASLKVNSGQDYAMRASNSNSVRPVRAF